MNVPDERQPETAAALAGSPPDEALAGIPGVAPALVPPLAAELEEAAAEDAGAILMEGTPVVSADGEALGTVAEVAGDRFRVATLMAPDYWLPLDAIDGVVPGGDLALRHARTELDAAKVTGPDG